MKLKQYANLKEKITLNTFLRNKIFNRTTRSVCESDSIHAPQNIQNKEDENQSIDQLASSINLNQFKVDQQKYQNQPHQKRIQYQYNEIPTHTNSYKNQYVDTNEYKKQPTNQCRVEQNTSNQIIQQKDQQSTSYKSLKKVISYSPPSQDRFQDSKFRKSKYSSRNPHLEFLHTSGSNKSLSASEKSILNLTNGLLSPEIHNSIKQKIRISSDNTGNIIQRLIKKNFSNQYLSHSKEQINQNEIRILDQFQSEQKAGVEKKSNDCNDIQKLKDQIKEMKQRLNETQLQNTELENNLKQFKQFLLKEKTLTAALKEQLAAYKNLDLSQNTIQSPNGQKPYVIQTSLYSPSSLVVKSPSTKQAQDQQLIQSLQRQIQQERQKNLQLDSQIQDLQISIKQIAHQHTKKINEMSTILKESIEDVVNKQFALKKEFNSSLSQMKKIFSFLGDQIVESERRALQLEKEKEDLVQFIDHYLKDAKGSQKSLSFLDDDTKTTTYSTN